MVAIAQAALTPVIAIIATYIAWQQWRVNESKLKLDRYDRRLKVYKEIEGFLAVVIQNAKVSTNDIRQLRVGTAEAHFLFGNDISKYIDELVAHGVRLGQANAEYRDYTQEIAMTTRKCVT
jgi:uncharacterized ubiquitin-like protein YukD